MADIPYLNTLNQTPENSKKMRRYITGMSITMFASFLAWTGMVLGIIFAVASLNVIFLPVVSGIAHRCHTWRHGPLCGIMYGVGFPFFFINVGMFFFSLTIWKTIVNKNMIKMKTLIKIGCYIMGGFELPVCAAGIITPLVFIIEHVTYLMIPVCICTIFAVFHSLMIHGVHKFKPRLVNTYIVFKIVIFALVTLLTLVSIIMSGVLMRYMAGVSIMTDINTFLLYSFFYFYSNGFIVLHYNIMIGNNTEEGSLNLTHSFTNKIHFIENTVNHI